MSMSGGVMSNVALDAALDELGMLSTVTNSRQQFLLERDRQYHLAALDIPQDLDIRPRNTNGGMRTRASSVSIINGKRAAKTKFPSMRYAGSQPSVDRIIQASRSGRIRRTQMENLSFCSSNELPNLDPVPYIALPIESSLSSNLFKSRSMESIDARTSDDSVCATERECLSSTIANLAEVDSVSSGLNRLNVNE